MTPRRRLLKLLVLPEDTGENGWRTVKEIVRKLLGYVVPGAPLWSVESSEHEWIDPKSTKELELIGASAWKTRSRKDTERKRDFKRAIVTHLLLHEVIDGRREPVGFVFFHHDGDDAWSHHPKCTRCCQFRELLLELTSTARAVVDRDTRVEADEKDAVVRRAMARLIAIEPHWSIEAWLYARSARAASLCHEQHGGRHDDDEAFWRAPGGELEEREQPKDRCCLADAHNLELARAFDASAAYGDSPSFTELVDAVLACGDLLHALQSLDIAAIMDR